MKSIIFLGLTLVGTLSAGLLIFDDKKIEPPILNAVYDGARLLVFVNYEEAKSAVSSWPVCTSGNFDEYSRLCVEKKVPIAFINASPDHLGFLDFAGGEPSSREVVITESPPKGKFFLVLWGPKNLP